jgi:hypothetical protein
MKFRKMRPFITTSLSATLTWRVKNTQPQDRRVHGMSPYRSDVMGVGGGAGVSFVIAVGRATPFGPMREGETSSSCVLTAGL